MNWGSKIETFVEISKHLACVSPDRIAYEYFDKQCRAVSRLTNYELAAKATAISRVLASERLKGERVVLAYHSGLEFVAAFFGCLYAGAIAVPVPASGGKRSSSRLSLITADSDAAIALTESKTLNTVRKVLRRCATTRHIGVEATDQIGPERATETGTGHADPNAIALLQYTSGSTQNPRGVMVTHANLVCNSRMMRARFGYSSESICVTWLPLYHDMGLIGGVLQPIFGGFRACLMSPASLLEKPICWLRAISSERATISGGPDFAYAHCVRNVSPEEASRLDLSCWKVAFTGSEPVRAETVDAFTTAFAPAGFRREAFFPCYGLAEATLMVSGGSRTGTTGPLRVSRKKLHAEKTVETVWEKDDEWRAMPSGRILGDPQLAIVDPLRLEPCLHNRVGEIWVRGESIAQGYWNHPSETQEIFQAKLKGVENISWLRTGDLGFIYRDELFVVGRRKDTIIIRGVNHWPQDLESTAQRVSPNLGSGAAFGTGSHVGEEMLVIVQEINDRARDSAPAIARAIRHAVTAEHGVRPHAIVLIRTGRVPKTSNGKIRRSACREMYQQNRLAVVHADVLPATELDLVPEDPPSIGQLLSLPLEARNERILEYLRSELVHATGRSPVEFDENAPIASLGLDSLQVARLCGHIEKTLHIEFSLSEVLGEATLATVAEELLQRVPTAVNSRSENQSQYPVASRLPLSYEQERLWWLNSVRKGLAQEIIGAALHLRGRFNVISFRQSVTYLMRRHEMLRVRFEMEGGVPWQAIERDGTCFCPIIDLTCVASGKRDKVLLESMAGELRRPFDLTREPLFRMTLYVLGAQHRILLITAHHIIADAASLRILARDFAAGYGATKGTQHSSRGLPRYAEFVLRQRAEVASQRRRLHEFWKQQLRGIHETWIPPVRPPADASGGPRSRLLLEIPSDVMTSVKEKGRLKAVTPFVVLLTAFKATLGSVFGRSRIAICSPVLGRPLPDFEEVVGMFAHPVVLNTDLSDHRGFADLLPLVKRTVLGAYDHQALPFSEILRLCSSHPGAASPHIAQIMFSLLLPADLEIQCGGIRFTEFPIDFASPSFALLVTVREQGRSTRVVFDFDSSCFEVGLIKRLGRDYIGTLRHWGLSSEVSHSPISSAPLARQDREMDFKIVVSATFTADPILSILEFWVEELGFAAAVACAPYGQIMQQLLGHLSLLRRNSDGVNVILVKVDDFWRHRADPPPPPEVDRLIHEFSAAIRTSSEKTGVPHIVCICPSTSHSGLTAAYQRAEARLASLISRTRNALVITPCEIEMLYGLHDFADPHADRVAHIPYREAFYAALGTLISRKIHSIRGRKHKVVVVDCDDTLWNGVCAEDGVSGIVVDTARKALQRVLLEQYDAGVLICVCSKNSEQDVMKVFETHPGMLLRREHLSAIYVNWNSKSENLRAISEELNLSLDSVVLIDNDPVECALVEAELPQVTVLQLPQQSQQIEEFLEHVWLFDVKATTDEDQRRSWFYHQERERQRALTDAPSVEEFLRSLGLRVEIGPLQASQMERVFQLTQRTTQFNTSGQKRSFAEIERLNASGELTFLTVSVSDRFGDYGLVGVVAFREDKSAIVVETLLLSCRVLGRGAENEILRYLARLARQKRLTRIRFTFHQTERNTPALEFLNRVKDLAATDGAEPEEFHFDVDRLVDLNARFDSGRISTEAREQPRGNRARPRVSERIGRALVRAAGELRKPDSVLRAIRDRRAAGWPVSASRLREEPATETEKRLLLIWRELLQVHAVGRTDDFFRLGGHSVLAAQVLARVSETFGVDLPIDVFFDEAPTIAYLARRIEEEQLRRAGPERVLQVLHEVRGLSDDEVRTLLSREDKQR